MMTALTARQLLPPRTIAASCASDVPCATSTAHMRSASENPLSMRGRADRGCAHRAESRTLAWPRRFAVASRDADSPQAGYSNVEHVRGSQAPVTVWPPTWA